MVWARKLTREATKETVPNDVHTALAGDYRWQDLLCHLMSHANTMVLEHNTASNPGVPSAVTCLPPQF